MSQLSKAKSSWVSDLGWPDVEKKIRLGACALLPIGASAKEHGLHLPMNTDYLQAHWLANQLAMQNNLLVWPVVSYGYYPAFVEFPGSVTLSKATFSLLINEIITSIFNAGITRLALLNTGISTIKPLDEIVRECTGDVSLINVYSGNQFKKASSEIIEQCMGGHADETETSIMLAINKSLVSMDKACGSMQACLNPGVLRRNNTQSLNYTPTGACGAPELASIEKGSTLLRAMLTDINDQLARLCFTAD